jgi:multidrug efflux system membrane fusion protein
MRISIAILLCALGASGCGANSSAAPAGARAESVPVVTARAETRDVPIDVLAVGHVEALATVVIKPQIAGQLTEAHFREGDEVARGDILLSIDARPYEVAVERERANVQALEASATDAHAMQKQMQEAIEKRAASQRSVDESQARAASLDAQLAAARAELRSAELSLEYCTIRAPIAGRTGTLLSKPGNVVKANETELVSLETLDPIQVGFSVPEQHLAAIAAARAKAPVRVRATIPGDVGGPLPTAIGELVFVENKVDGATGTIRLRASFDNSARRLWPGQFVQVALELGSLQGAVVVPASAVQTGQTGSVAYVVKSDHTVDLRTIEVARRLDREAVIASGIAAGEEVVITGQLRLMPGASVTTQAAESRKANESPGAKGSKGARAEDGKSAGTR